MPITPGAQRLVTFANEESAATKVVEEAVAPFFPLKRSKNPLNLESSLVTNVKV